MSKDSTQNIPQEATILKKLAKATARYMEIEELKDSDHHASFNLSRRSIVIPQLCPY
jgi:hypothetical protein